MRLSFRSLLFLPAHLGGVTRVGVENVIAALSVVVSVHPDRLFRPRTTAIGVSKIENKGRNEVAATAVVPDADGAQCLHGTQGGLL